MWSHHTSCNLFRCEWSILIYQAILVIWSPSFSNRKLKSCVFCIWYKCGHIDFGPPLKSLLSQFNSHFFFSLLLHFNPFSIDICSVSHSVLSNHAIMFIHRIEFHNILRFYSFSSLLLGFLFLQLVKFGYCCRCCYSYCIFCFRVRWLILCVHQMHVNLLGFLFCFVLFRHFLSFCLLFLFNSIFSRLPYWMRIARDCSVQIQIWETGKWEKSK